MNPFPLLHGVLKEHVLDAMRKGKYTEILYPTNLKKGPETIEEYLMEMDEDDE